MNYALYLAALLIFIVGLAHSYLGERYILIRLFRRGDLPKIWGSADLTRQTLRLAWHITTVAWLGLAAVLLNLAYPPVTAGSLCRIIGVCFLLQFLVSAVGGRGRHFSWLFFLAIGLLCLYAAQG
ncbi:hypothetical protein [Undibacterium sp. TS12]|uniref:hypothetical protein n=1 Tax=Undibacterium sp. TS12 TaxID=2908202 RepID=UPI001F4C9701|nr:hypothetical protein [Undibacterium sp. TS12]MCH8620433.1 hypothetical protein [Undibacterium sp. TS12]